MPKIRGIKPDYWTDEDIVELSIPARLLYVGLWNYACDNGHLQDKPKQIKMRIFPGDDVNCSELLRELEASGRISRADGWITVPNLSEHQKIDVRYFTTCDKEGCEDPPEKVSQRETRRAHAGRTTGQQRAHDGRTTLARGDGDGDSDGDGERVASPARRAHAVQNASTEARKRAHQLPDDFVPDDTNRRIAAERGVDLRAAFEQFADHHHAKGSTFKDWHLAFNTWLRRERPSASVVPINGVRQLPDGSIDESTLPPVEQSWMARRPT